MKPEPGLGDKAAEVKTLGPYADGGELLIILFEYPAACIGFASHLTMFNINIIKF